MWRASHFWCGLATTTYYIYLGLRQTPRMTAPFAWTSLPAHPPPPRSQALRRPLPSSTPTSGPPRRAAHWRAPPLPSTHPRTLSPPPAPPTHPGHHCTPTRATHARTAEHRTPTRAAPPHYPRPSATRCSSHRRPTTAPQPGPPKHPPERHMTPPGSSPRHRWNSVSSQPQPREPPPPHPGHRD
jgi:hypothetical protein